MKNPKREFILNQFELGYKNPAKFWETMAHLIPSKNNTELQGVFNPDTDEYSDVKDAEKVINKYFANIGKILNDKLPHPTQNFPVPQYVCTMAPMRIIDVSAVELYISKIDDNKSYGLPLIYSKLLKIALDNQSIRFCHLMNMCISSSIFPLSWKVGTVGPYQRKVTLDMSLTCDLLPYGKF